MLLLTDRPVEGRRLQDLVGAVEPCTLLTVAEAGVPASSHAAIICDVALDDPGILAATKAILARHRIPRTVPMLCLARQPDDAGTVRAQEVGADAVLPCTVSDAQILFTVKQLIASVRTQGGRHQADAAVAARARDAKAALAALFDGARRGTPITAAALEQGGEAVMAAVAGDRIGAWLDVVRDYDDVTYQHCLLVAGLSAGFSVRLGLSLKGQRLVSRAALVHDIGKARIPHAILNKADALTAAETAVMRTHAVAGYDLLARQGGFDPQLLDIVRHHHEFIDGSGYPDRLRGEEVPALVRLVTICDIYAALIERRTYKPPLAGAAALRILDTMRGQLDAGLLGRFKAMVGAG